MYTAKLIIHNGQSRIAVTFEKKAELIERFKKLKGARWSATLKSWHLPDTEEYRIKFALNQKQSPASIEKQSATPLSTEAIIQQCEKFVQWLRADDTVKTP